MRAFGATFGPARLLLSAVVILASLGSVATAEAQSAAPLFQAAPEAEATAPLARTPGRSRLVRMSLPVRAAKIGPVDTDHVPDRALRAETLDPDVTIDFFPDVRARFRRKAVRAAEDGGYVWSGAAGKRGSAALVVEGETVSGYAELDGKAYRIEPVAGSLHRIVEVDPARDRPDIVRRGRYASPAQPLKDEKTARQAEPEDDHDVAEADEEGGKTTVTLLVAFTPQAKAMAPHMGMDIELAVQLANEAYEKSRAQIRLRLAGKMLVDYREGGDWSRNLQDLTSGDALASVRARRDRLKADLVTLIRDPGAYCGIAWYTPSPSKETSEEGFSVVARDCISYHSLAHELGHNLGLQHDRYAAGGGEGFNYGYVNVGARIRSIMAYDDRCVARGITCTRVNAFSTPRRRFDHEEIGVAARERGAADNARRLNATRKAVSKYR